MSKNKIVTKEWLNNIYNRNYGKSDIMIGILRLIARFNPEDINPQGQTMATAALIHRILKYKNALLGLLKVGLQLKV